MVKLICATVFAMALMFGFSFPALAGNVVFPLVNGGDKVLITDPIARSTVMLESEAEYCSATIITDGLLLTAAHCINESEPSILIHFSGLEGTLSRTATRFFRHEAYQDLQGTTLNDVALVFFTGGLPDGFSPVTILPIDQDLEVGDSLQLAGYGAGGPLGSLTTVNLNISEFLNAKTQIRLNQTSKRGICQGDSGGPAFKIIKGQLSLAGVASYVQEMDCSGYSVYTRAAIYIDWIQKKQKLSPL